ncbi:hypothetical protein G3570_00650 [Balneolaceae bacterium YR4-1]|uniref:Uncharacterized protein n=1 Tax=Halalkalibaculum roseum TaxID=2709311 RepID=A0A6M1T427_9BACT|nr:hypothetical protein [Halalkalibaculum roseum]NGP75123.1 hypothetical protein [Halalkalibaculum roseum]
MSWEALSVVAQIASTIAVFITLIYIAIQVKIINHQRELNAFRHTYDSLNVFCDKMSQSPEIGSIIHRGRTSLEALDPGEKIVFQHIHLRLLNTLESWYVQVMRTSSRREDKELQIRNIGGLVSYYLNYPGTKDVWNNVKTTFEPIQELVENNIQ